MVENPSNLLNDGISELRKGNKQKAREILLILLEREPNNLSALLWISITAEYREDAIPFLNRARTISNSDLKIMEGFKWANKLPRKEIVSSVALPKIKPEQNTSLAGNPTPNNQNSPIPEKPPAFEKQKSYSRIEYILIGIIIFCVLVIGGILLSNGLGDRQELKSSSANQIPTVISPPYTVEGYYGSEIFHIKVKEVTLSADVRSVVHLHIDGSVSETVMTSSSYETFISGRFPDHETTTWGHGEYILGNYSKLGRKINFMVSDSHQYYQSTFHGLISDSFMEGTRCTDYCVNLDYARINIP